MLIMEASQLENQTKQQIQEVPHTTQPGAPPGEGQAPGAIVGGVPMMAMPTQVPVGCPPGLAYLAQIDQIVVKQKVEVLEVAIGVETGNKYEVYNSMGQKVFFVYEQMRCEGCYGCCLYCCGGNSCTACCKCCQMQCCKSRPLNFIVKDNAGNKVLRLHRPCRCSSCWFPCCMQKLEVFTMEDQLIGTVRQTWGLCHPHYNIQDENDTTVLKIKGPCCTWRGCCGADVDFKVLGTDGETQVGRVAKQWSGVVKELYTDVDNFGITFPVDLDVKAKASMLAACLLIDLMYFESGPVKKTA